MEEVIYPTLYTKDSDGDVRIWFMKRLGNKICNVSGKLDGKLTTSTWKVIKGKNVGKSNETTAEEQAESDIEATYRKQEKKHGYWRDISEINQTKYIEPMLAQKLADNPFNPLGKPPIVYLQPKLDGYRCLANGVSNSSKHGDPFQTVGHIMERLNRSMRVEIKMFDGELYNHNLSENFNLIQSLVSKKKPSLADLNAAHGTIEYHVYDFVPTDEYAHLTYGERQVILREAIPDDDPIIILVETEEVQAATYAELMERIEQNRLRHVNNRYEGQIIRIGEGKYEIGRRTEFLLKNKVFIDEEYTVKDILEGTGNAAGKAAKALLENAEGVEFKAGLIGDTAYCQQILREKAKYIGGDATVRYFNLTPGKKVPRHGKVVAFYEGKRKI